MLLQTIIKKIRLIYLPFLAVMVTFIVAYTFLNWLIFVRTDKYFIREELIHFWFPVCLSLIPVLIWLRPRLRQLKLKGGYRHFSFLYQLLAAVAIAVPASAAQTFIERTGGTLTRLESIDQIRTTKPSRFYTVGKYYLDKPDYGMHAARGVSTNNRLAYMNVYYAVPITVNLTDANHAGWMGIKYTKTISNLQPTAVKDKIFKAFENECRDDFYDKDFTSFKYLKRVNDRADVFGFRKAKIKSLLYELKERPVLFAVNQPFEDRAGNSFATFIILFAAAAGIWLILLIFPDLAGKYPHAESYIIGSPEYQVLNAIEIFKTINPEHFGPEYLKDGLNMHDRFDGRHHLYFYYPEDFQIVFAWSRAIDGYSTEIALVAINDGLVPGNWKDINKDFVGEDNEMQKEKFVALIVDKIVVLMQYGLKTG